MFPLSRETTPKFSIITEKVAGTNNIQLNQPQTEKSVHESETVEIMTCSSSTCEQFGKAMALAQLWLSLVGRRHDSLDHETHARTTV
jgi:hypothetical protein